VTLSLLELLIAAKNLSVALLSQAPALLVRQQSNVDNMKGVEK